MRVSPCKDCKLRYPACHDKCDPYQKWRKEKAAANKTAYEREKHKRRKWW